MFGSVLLSHTTSTVGVPTRFCATKKNAPTPSNLSGNVVGMTTSIAAGALSPPGLTAVTWYAYVDPPTSPTVPSWYARVGMAANVEFRYGLSAARYAQEAGSGMVAIRLKAGVASSASARYTLYAVCLLYTSDAAD